MYCPNCMGDVEAYIKEGKIICKYCKKEIKDDRMYNYD